MIKNVFLDLDGTLADPMDGITNCINYSLEKLGKSLRPKKDLLDFIGPPLRQTYASLLATEDEDLIEKAIAFYRERFPGSGMYENELYDGIKEAVTLLKSLSLKLFVVTSKPTVYSEKIIRHFGLEGYFDGVFGPELNGRFDDKTELMAHIVDSLNIEPEETIMIGDRRVDMTAAKSNGIKTMAVTYGYGSREELFACDPDYICDSPAQIAYLLTANS